MSSERQIAANRANGAKSRGPVTPEGKLKSSANSAHSTGPRTPEGKARSSRNAIRHGLLAQSIVLDTESVEMFIRILADHEADLRPADAIEHRFVDTMAIAEWTRRRLLTIGTEQLAMEMERQQNVAAERFATPAGPRAQEGDAPAAADSATIEINPARILVQAFHALTAESRTAELVSRYENRCDRQYTRALKGLREYRAEKRRMLRDVREPENRRDARLRMRRMRRTRKNEKNRSETK